VFVALCTWKNRLLCLKLCCFYKTKVGMLKFAALMAKCLMNNFWKFHQKILNYSENNEIFVGGCFLAAPGRIAHTYTWLYVRISNLGAPCWTPSPAKKFGKKSIMACRRPSRCRRPNIQTNLAQSFQMFTHSSGLWCLPYLPPSVNTAPPKKN